MTDPNQPQWQQPGQNGPQRGEGDQRGVPPVPPAPGAPGASGAPAEPAFGAYAAPDQQTPPVPGGFDAPGAPGSYGSPAGGAGGYGAPGGFGAPGAPGAPGGPGAPGSMPAAPPPYGQPNPYGAPNPYAGQGAGGEYAPSGPVPTSWRVWTAFPLALIATLFFPPLFGGAAIVLSSLALKRREKLAQVALIVSIVCTVIGLVLGAIVNSQ